MRSALLVKLFSNTAHLSGASTCIRHSSNQLTRNYSNAAVTARRLQIFEDEKQRQRKLVTDTHKITVEYRDQPDPCTLYMNKMLSTPYDCAKHVSQVIGNRAVLAEVDGQVWDMHRPLEADVECLKFLHFRESDPFYVNKAFWRSCSLLLGAVLESAFKNAFYVQLCSFPAPNVRTGSFIYDVDLGMDWSPSKDELRVLSSEMVKLSMAALPFERLAVPAAVAAEMFRDNKYKSVQVPSIAEQSNGEVVVYRVGNLVDVSRGPMMANTAHLGRVSVTAVHKISDTLHRVQAVALPKDILMNHFSYRILEERARKMNEGRLPELAELSAASQ